MLSLQRYIPENKPGNLVKKTNIRYTRPAIEGHEQRHKISSAADAYYNPQIFEQQSGLLSQPGLQIVRNNQMYRATDMVDYPTFSNVTPYNSNTPFGYETLPGVNRTFNRAGKMFMNSDSVTTNSSMYGGGGNNETFYSQGNTYPSIQDLQGYYPEINNQWVNQAYQRPFPHQMMGTQPMFHQPNGIRSQQPIINPESMRMSQQSDPNIMMGNSSGLENANVGSGGENCQKCSKSQDILFYSVLGLAVIEALIILSLVRK